MIGKDRGNCQAKLVPQTWGMKEATAAFDWAVRTAFWARRRKYTAQPRVDSNQVLTIELHRHFATQIKNH